MERQTRNSWVVPLAFCRARYIPQGRSGVTLNIRGNSYRLKEKLKAGLVRLEEAEARTMWEILNSRAWGKLGSP